jgi:ABC-2 type transport system permease protein
MRSLYAIYRKEMGHYFVSPIAYVVVGLFLILCGFFFNLYLSDAIRASMEAQMQSAQMGMASNFDVPSEVIRAFLGVLALFLLFFMPMITMGVYSDERRRGTMELLMTSPITETQIVLGKFFASLTLFAVMLVPTASYILFMWFKSEPMPPLRIVAGGYLGLLLFGGALLALGQFLSSLTENPIIAAILTFAAFLLLWALDFGSSGASSTPEQIVHYISVINHYQGFTQGVIDTSALVYYVSFIAFFIFLTVRSVDSMRWRRA